MVPQNLSEWLPNKKYQINGSANYLITGGWSNKAADYAKFHTSVNTVYDSSENSYTSVRDIKDWNINPDVDYFYYCANETIHGLEIHETPDISSPIICDMSSTLCTRPININDFDLIFAGAQKNLGIAGLTIVIVKKELINGKAEHLPPLLRYESHSLDNSMLNTSPVFAWYVAGLVFNWIITQGGLQSMSELNQEKSSLLYDFIDDSQLYKNSVNPKYRSWVNIPFTMTNKNLDEWFLKEASNEGLMNLKGHRTVGGMRASVYNAMPIEGVKKLIAFMENFETTNFKDV
jgi:phosphoserine aminotransferase